MKNVNSNTERIFERMEKEREKIFTQTRKEVCKVRGYAGLSCRNCKFAYLCSEDEKIQHIRKLKLKEVI